MTRSERASAIRECFLAAATIPVSPVSARAQKAFCSLIETSTIPAPSRSIAVKASSNTSSTNSFGTEPRS